MPASPGDDALAEVCQREFPRLVGLLALRVSDQRIAEELAQDALVRLCQHWPGIDRSEAWLTRVALNMGNSWLRRRFAERRAYHRHGPAAEHELPPASAEMLAIREAVSQLPDRQRTAVILRYYDELSVAETAEVMSCSQSSVKTLTHRAITRMRSEGGLTAEEATGNA